MIRTVGLTLVLMGAAAAPLFGQHVGYWNEATAGGKTFPCALVENQGDMVSILRQAGWPTEKGFPVVDWSNDCAVVISPGEYYKNGKLAFWGVVWEGGQFRLKYGWQRLASESVGTSSASFGSSSEGTPGVIVVSFKHYMHASNAFVCSNRGFDPE